MRMSRSLIKLRTVLMEEIPNPVTIKEKKQTKTDTISSL